MFLFTDIGLHAADVALIKKQEANIVGTVKDTANMRYLIENL